MMLTKEHLEVKVNIQQASKTYGGLENLLARPGHMLVTLDFDCYPEGTEVLTKRGWVDFAYLRMSDQVFQVDPTTLAGSYTAFTNYKVEQYVGDLHVFGNKRGSLAVTPNHRMLWLGQTHKSLNYRRESLAHEGIPVHGLHIGTAATEDASTNKYWDISERDLWIALLLQADGARTSSGSAYQIEVTKQRKINKITELLGPPSGVYNGRVKWAYVKFSSPLLVEGKTLDLSGLHPNMVNCFVDALTFWDGTPTSGGGCVYGQVDEMPVDTIQAYLTTSGVEARKIVEVVSTPWRREPFNFYKLRIKRKDRMRVRPGVDVRRIPYSGRIFCVSVPSGYLLVRQGGQTFVSGNCLEDKVLAGLSRDPNKLLLVGPGAKPNCGYIFNGANVPGVGQPFLDMGYDPYNSNAEIISKVKKELKPLRSMFKAFSLAFNYGAQPKKLQKILQLQGFHLTLEEVENIHRSMTDLYAVTGRYTKFLEAQWRQNGGWVLNGMGMPICCDGDKLKDLLNRVIQSSGHVILMYYIEIFTKELDKARISWKPSIIDWHDASTVEVPEEQAEETAHIMNESVHLLNDLLIGDREGMVPMTGKAAIHKNYAEDKCEDKEPWYERYQDMLQVRGLLKEVG